MKHFFSLLALFLTLNSVSSFGRDIESTESNLYIKVEKNKYKQIRFSLCQKNLPKIPCRVLGSGYYSEGILKSQRLKEQLEAGVSVVGTVVAAAVGGVTGIGLSVLTGSVGTVALTVIGVSGTAAAGIQAISDLGPIEQLKQQYLLRPEVVQDKDVKLSVGDKEMGKIAYRLDIVLNKIVK